MLALGTHIRDSLVTEGRAMWVGGKGRSLVIIAVGWGMLIGTRMVYPVLLPYLRAEFHFNLTISGLLLTILWLGSAIGQLPGGILADQYSERKVLVVSICIVIGGLILLVVSPTLALLIAFTGVIGLGQSLYPVARITILSSIYPDRVGRALGITMAVGDLCQTILPPIAGFLALLFVWQVGFGFLLPLFILTAIGLWVILPEETPGKNSVDLSMDTVRYILAELHQARMVLLAVVLLFCILLWQSFTGFFPTYLVEVKGLSTAVAGIICSVCFAFGIFVKIISGMAYDRMGIRGSLLLILIGPVFGFGLLPSVSGFWPLVGVTALVSTMLGSGTITQSYLADTFSKKMQGTGLGVIRTVTATLGAAGPILFGIIADLGYFDEGYLILAGLVFGIILLTLRIPRP
jgi:MFS family permease